MTNTLYYVFLGFQNTKPEVLFGNPKTESDVTKSYKELARKFHPDKYSTTESDLEWATKIFSLLGEYRDQLNILVKKGSTATSDPDVEFNIRIGKNVIKFTQVIHKGDLSLIVRSGLHVLKILRDPNDIDFYKRAEANLKVLRDGSHFDKYMPGSITPVSINIAGVNHPGQYYSYLEGYTIEQVKARYPNLDVKHATWMINRVFEILSHSHDKGIANMAVLPRHIIIKPETHGGALLDWSCSTNGKPVAVADTTNFGVYPSFVFDKPDDVRYADIIMLFDIYKWLVDEDRIPVEIKTFYRNIYNGYYRGRSTIDIYKRFRNVLGGIWKNEFLKFTME